MKDKIWRFDELICGYTVEVFDFPKQISKPTDMNYIALPRERSPLHVIFSLKAPAQGAFAMNLSPISETRENLREEAIKEEIIKWVLQKAEFVFNLYKRKIKNLCSGDCSNIICLEKAIERSI
jgi:hypothetical protein